MSDLELKRRKVHGVLSSKSLLESVERLTLNKTPLQKSKSNLNIKKPNEVSNYFIFNAIIKLICILYFI